MGKTQYSDLSPSEKAVEMVELFWKRTPRYVFGSGERDLSDSIFYSKYVAANVLEEATKYTEEPNSGIFGYWQEVLRTLDEMELFDETEERS